MRDLVGVPPGPRLTRLLAQAGGNPLYVRELVDVLVREGRLKIKPGVAAEVEGAGELPVPISLRAAVAGRIESMSEATQQIVRLAALLGPEFSVVELATLFGRPVPELADAMMAAYRAGVLVDSGERTVFRHPLIRQVLYEAVPAGLRAALHRQAARALAGTGAPVDRVAEPSGGVGGDGLLGGGLAGGQRGGAGGPGVAAGGRSAGPGGRAGSPAGSAA